MRVTAIITVYCLVLFAASGEESPSPQELIHRMGDPALSVEEHQKAASALRKIHTKEVIPILIKARTEQNVFDPQAPVSGALGGTNPTYILHVGEACEDILMVLITDGLSPTSKDHPYSVRDWDAWWEKHRGMTLEQIQAEAHTAYDEYYRKEHAQQAALDDRSFRGKLTHTPQELIHRMGEPNVSVEDRRKASNELAKMGGKEIIPALIEGMKDQRVFDPEVDAAGQSEYLTAPGEPPHKRMTYVETVDMACMSILRELLSIPVSKGTNYYPVENWDAWWHNHRDMTLEQMRQEVQDAVKKQRASDSSGRAQ